MVGPYIFPVRKRLQVYHRREFDVIKKKIDKLQLDLSKKKNMQSEFTESIQVIQMIKEQLD